jgi:hypothetical protein
MQEAEVKAELAIVANGWYLGGALSILSNASIACPKLILPSSPCVRVR